MEAKSGTNAIMIDGSSGGENRWIIDGAESTDIESGSQGKTMVTDFVEEVQVKSSGYTAEYGGSTGGVINVLSKSGSNQWRGDAFLYYQSEALDSDPRPTLRLKPSNDRESEYVTYAEGRVQPPRAGLQPQRAARPRQGLVLRRLPPAVPAARPHRHVPLRRRDPDLRPGLPVEPPVLQPDRAARAAVPRAGGVQPEQREVRGHAARPGRHRQPQRELRASTTSTRTGRRPRRSTTRRATRCS